MRMINRQLCFLGSAACLPDFVCVSARVLALLVLLAIPARTTSLPQLSQNASFGAREIRSGQTHTYPLSLAAGQFLHIVVEQNGVDVAISLFAPDGRLLFEFDDELRLRGREEVTFVAEAAGRYQLEVRPKWQHAAGRYEARVIEIRQAQERERALQEARRLLIAAQVLAGAGKFAEARTAAERAVALREQHLGTAAAEVALALYQLANLHSDQGEDAAAAGFLQRAQQMTAQALGSAHPQIAACLAGLATLARNRGDYAEAETLQQRALSIWEMALGADHPYVARTLDNLANLYQAKGDYARVEPLRRRALQILEQALGAGHPSVALSLSNLAAFYGLRGDYAQAEPLLRRALRIYETSSQAQPLDVARTLDTLANLAQAKGDVLRAVPLYQRALRTAEFALGRQHPGLAPYISNLASSYSDRGQYALAEPLLRRALRIFTEAYGAVHPATGQALLNLSTLQVNKGDLTQAAAQAARARQVLAETLGAEHPLTAAALTNQALVAQLRGAYAQAEPWLQQALTSNEKSLGPEHPVVAQTLGQLSQLAEARGNLAQAVHYLTRAVAVSERNLKLNLAVSSERQKLAYLATLTGEWDRALTLQAHAAQLASDTGEPASASALRLALTLVLQRKGRALDAAADSLATLRKRADAAEQASFDQLRDARAQLARLAFEPGPVSVAQQRERDTLAERAEELEAALSRRSEEFSSQTQHVTLATVQATIPSGGALLEFASYRPFKAQRKSAAASYDAPQYAAFVLRSQGEPQWINLGPVTVIDRAVQSWRQALRDPARTDAQRLGRAVYELVFRPLRASLGDARQLLLSPDGALNLIPFAALVDDEQRFLLERYTCSYLTSGRDLLRLTLPRPPGGVPVIVAQPDYGDLPLTRRHGQTRFDTERLFFQPLPGTAREARALKALLPEAHLLVKEQATEQALKQLHAPHVLHLATHGFFLPRANAENPLLRAGLALAGANQGQAAGEDGLLTALEAAGLNLWGTKLVALSACDTGVGEIKTGEGVYGLRRAFVLAGAESLVMSLWSVSDQATRAWMTAYYEALQAGQARADALRQVQMQMLRNAERQHPYYWAGFIQSGGWGTLTLQR